MRLYIIVALQLRAVNHQTAQPAGHSHGGKQTPGDNGAVWAAVDGEGKDGASDDGAETAAGGGEALGEAVKGAEILAVGAGVVDLLS